MIINDERMVEAKAIQEFSIASREQLNHILIDERDAKVGLVAGIVMGGNIALVGDPGGAKTRILENGHRIIEGIEDERVARVPALEDMTPQQVVGGQIVTDETFKTIDADGNETENRLIKTTRIKGLIRPDAQVMHLDEINRMGSAVQNALLTVQENRYVDNGTGERIKFDGLEYVISTMNPNEEEVSVFPMSAAAASRHAIGITVGGQDKETNRPVAEGILIENFTPRPDKMEAQTTINGLHMMRKFISEQVVLPKSVASEFAVNWALNIQEVLREEHGIPEAVGRMSVQVREVSRVLAGLDGESEVKEGHIRQAVKFLVGARIGLLGVGRTFHAEAGQDPIDATVAKIFES